MYFRGKVPFYNPGVTQAGSLSVAHWDDLDPLTFGMGKRDAALTQYVDATQGAILHRNWKIQRRLSQEIPKELQRDAAVLIIGSDARLENAPGAIMFSPLEFIVLGRDEQVKKLHPMLEAIVARSDDIPFMRSDIEDIRYHPDSADSRILSGYEGSVHRSWPDRILDAQVILGDSDIFHSAARKIFEEWQTIKDVRESVKAYFRTFLKVTETGVGIKYHGEEKEHFDPDSGDLYFDPEQGVRGLKCGPIRTMQVFLTMKRLSDGIDKGYALPSNTYDKLCTLFPEEPVVARAYLEALVLYHEQQQRRAEGMRCQHRVNPEHLQWICETISGFVKGQRELLVTKPNHSLVHAG